MSLSNWQKIDTFDEQVEWQKALAIEVNTISREVAKEFGGEGCDYGRDGAGWREDYKDNIVQIVSIYEYDERYNERSHETRIHLVPSLTEVFKATMSYHIPRWFNDNDEWSIRIFRAGSWLNHIESLRLRLEKPKVDPEIMKQREAKDRLERFGRLD